MKIDQEKIDNFIFEYYWWFIFIVAIIAIAIMLLIRQIVEYAVDSFF